MELVPGANLCEGTPLEKIKHWMECVSVNMRPHVL